MNKKQIGQIREKIRESSESLTDFLAENWIEEYEFSEDIPYGLDPDNTKDKKIRENLKYLSENFYSFQTSKEKVNFFDMLFSFVDDCFFNIQLAVRGLSDDEYGLVMDPYTDKLVRQVSVASFDIEKLRQKAKEDYEWED